MHGSRTRIEHTYLYRLQIGPLDHATAVARIDSCVERQRLVRPDPSSSASQLAIHCHELNYLVVVDKLVDTFALFSYSAKTAASMDTAGSAAYNRVRYLHKRDEKDFRKFVNVFARALFRFKIVHMDSDLQLYFVLTVSKKSDDDDGAEPVDLSSAIFKARIVSTVNRRNERNVEVEVVRVHSFCRAYFVAMVRDELTIGLNHACDLDVEMARDQAAAVADLRDERNRALVAENRVSVAATTNEMKNRIEFEKLFWSIE